ncbi:MAG TPA: branched-chain amino acid transaminase [Candidatus Angelobacter sp.]|nr:branched-chain amino acid transaminase [Candidatus Angelobacter sp.]
MTLFHELLSADHAFNAKENTEMENIPSKPPLFSQAHRLWLNGGIVPWNAGTTNVFSHGLHYGSGVFEGIRAYKTAKGPGVFRLQAHLDRLFESAASYGMQLPYSKQRLAEAVFQVMEANSLFGNSYIRPLCWYGAHDLGLTSRKWPMQVAVVAWEWGSIFGEEKTKEGIRVAIAPWKKIHSSMLPTTAKGCGQYLNSLLAAQYAVERGYDEALLLDIHGNIAEGPGENIFLVKDNRLLTNDQRSSILMGITRQSIITIATDLNIDVEIRPLVPNDLFSAQEAFFTGTAVEIVPIREVDGVLIGTPNAERFVTKRIQQAFQKITTGRNQAYRHWVEHNPFAEKDNTPELALLAN